MTPPAGPAATDGVGWLELADGIVEYEVLAAAPGHETDPPVVFLHEGLGSLGLWRGFPRAVLARTGRTGVVWSRHGYGNSAVVREPRAVRYMHDEALRVLPEMLERLAITDPVLIGHSDGASIALIYAGVRPVAGLVLIAPHVMVDDWTAAGIRSAHEQYLTTDLGRRLGRWHDDPDATFRGWSDIWRSPEFRAWNIEGYLAGVTCPILAVQALDDEYGTIEQLDRVERGVHGPVTRLVLDVGGHSPHLADPDYVVGAVAGFLGGDRPVERDPAGSGGAGVRGVGIERGGRGPGPGA